MGVGQTEVRKASDYPSLCSRRLKRARLLADVPGEKALSCPIRESTVQKAVGRLSGGVTAAWILLCYYCLSTSRSAPFTGA